MTARILASLLPVTLFVSAIVGGCSSSSGAGGSCTPGESRACSCASGGSGTETCGTNGEYAACSCGSASGDSGAGGDSSSSDDASSSGDACADGSTGPGCDHGDGSTPGYDGGWEAGAPGTFGSACTQNSDCQSMDCFDFNAKGMRCTQPCTTNADCPNPPNLGCSGMGQCKVP